MYRVKTLIDKLRRQLDGQASAADMLLTVQMLQHELQAQPAGTLALAPGVAVQMPSAIPPANGKPVMPMPLVADGLSPIKSAVAAQPPLADENPFVPAASDSEPEKVVAVLQVDEAELAAELEELKRNAATLQQLSAGAKPPTLFDLASEEIPTLAHQPAAQEVHQLINTGDALSLNDLHASQPAPELSEKLSDSPVKDLKKAIGINDRFLFISELFRGDEVMYERSIKTINSFAIWPEAEYWIRRELKTKLGWLDAEPTVKLFDQLVKRRFA
jgi:hypothetical protein